MVVDGAQLAEDSPVSGSCEHDLAALGSAKPALFFKELGAC